MNIQEYLDETKECITQLECQKHTIDNIVKLIDESDTIFICGNGGSAATASHMVNDLVKMIGKKSYCLSDNVPTLTAYANDIGYGTVFYEPLYTLGNDRDLLIVISGSGNSENIIAAIDQAITTGMKTVAFLGLDGGEILEHKLADKILHIETDMLHSEDIHLLVAHCIMEQLMELKK